MSNQQPRPPRAFALPEGGIEAGSQTPKKAPTKSAKAASQTKPTKAKSKSTRKPRAIADTPSIKPVADEAAQRSEALSNDVRTIADNITPPPPIVAKRKLRWSKVFVGALAGLVSLAMGLWVDQLIRDLFQRQDWLGWLAVSLTALLVIAAFAGVLRESLSLRRLRQINSLRDEAEQARLRNDMKQARAVSSEIVALYNDRPDTAKGRAALSVHADEIIDGRDLIHLTERDLLRPLDAKARAMVMASAKRVSVVTAVSPRAIVDVSYVLLENTRLIRRIADHYGGKPGTLGFWRLTRNVLAHLAVTGSIAIGDGLMQQVIGTGLAAKLSARLGEGVVNGMLTARIGISAIDVCRPLAFTKEARPGVKDFMGELLKTSPEGSITDSSERNS